MLRHIIQTARHAKPSLIFQVVVGVPKHNAVVYWLPILAKSRLHNFHIPSFWVADFLCHVCHFCGPVVSLLVRLPVLGVTLCEGWRP
jgi:hypothetical protein